MTTITDHTSIARAISEMIVEYQITGLFDGDAGDLFDVDTWEGYGIRSYLDTFCIERATLDEPGIEGIEGTIVIHDPDGGTMEFEVTTSRFGDVEIV